LTALGLPGWRLLVAPNRDESLVMEAVADLVVTHRDTEREALAARIIDRLAKAVNK
jgi:hypothetical protein